VSERLPRLSIERPPKERYGDFIYGQLLEQITSGAFIVGMRLPSEKEFSQIFDVSRPVIRQALARLQADGIVISRRGSGTILNNLPPPGLMQSGGSAVADMLRVFEARLALEAATAKLAAVRKTDQDIKQLEEVMGEYRQEFETNAIRPEYDMAFHRTIAEASNNRHLLALFQHLEGAIEKGLSVNLGYTRLGSKERAQRILDEHERIYDALMDGDGDAAQLAMSYHLDQARRRLIDGSRRY
jgi:DNA-binding FadR family transcriptional regulator